MWDWLSGRSLPGRNKLVTFLAVCGIPAEEWHSWIEAVSRARKSARGRIATDHDPLQLGVHPAIHAASEGTDDGEDLNVLTPYVVRDHDLKLGAWLRGGCGHQLVVLVGGAATRYNEEGEIVAIGDGRATEGIPFTQEPVR